MKKLISMTDFVLDLYEKWIEDCEKTTHGMYVIRTGEYSKFLKQPLELWMFVPCKLVDGLWVVLEEWHDIDNRNVLFDEAKKRCLFQNIEYVKAKNIGEYSFVRIAKLSSINYPNFWDGVTVESLIPYDLELTQTALQQLGL